MIARDLLARAINASHTLRRRDEKKNNHDNDLGKMVVIEFVLRHQPNLSDFVMREFARDIEYTEQTQGIPNPLAPRFIDGGHHAPQAS